MFKRSTIPSEAVENFLDSLSGILPPSHCPDCGSAMVHKYGTFFLLKGEKSWTIPLPVCPKCDMKPQQQTEGFLAA